MMEACELAAQGTALTAFQSAKREVSNELALDPLHAASIVGDAEGRLREALGRSEGDSDFSRAMDERRVRKAQRDVFAGALGVRGVCPILERAGNIMDQLHVSFLINEGLDTYVGSRGQVYRGGEAKFLATAVPEVEQVVNNVLGLFATEELQALGNAFQAATEAQHEATERLLIVKYGKEWWESLDQATRERPYDSALPRQVKHLLGSLNVSSDPCMMLRGETRSGTEQIAEGIIDMQLAFYETGCPVSLLSPNTLRNLRKTEWGALAKFWGVATRLDICEGRADHSQMPIFAASPAESGSNVYPVRFADPYAQKCYESNTPHDCVGAIADVEVDEQTKELFEQTVAKIAAHAEGNETDLTGPDSIRSSLALTMLVGSVACSKGAVGNQ